MLKGLLALLVLLLLWLQIQLWFGEGSLAHKAELDGLLDAKNTENQDLQERNARIAKQVASLKNGLESIEEKAREDLGMIKRGETFYLVIDEPSEEVGDEP
ncbi:MAG: septum formation initiator family protein [Porticoccaceae bacterium]|nr:septum formation initiator family protein [Porticoccaceae bacterium]